MTFNDAMSPYFSTFGLCQPISTLFRCGSVFYFLITSNVTVHLKHGSLIALPWLVPFLFFDLNKCKTWSFLNVYVYQFFCSSELAWIRTSGSVPRTGRRTSEGSQRSANSLQTQVQDGIMVNKFWTLCWRENTINIKKHTAINLEISFYKI